MINILGLTIGLTCSLLILLWVQDERSVDNFHEQGSQLYLVYERQILTDKTIGGYKTPGMLAAEMKRAIPEISKASNFAWIDDSPDRLTFEKDHQLLKFDACYADADYFQMMSYPLLQGTSSSALSKPGSLCISNKMATAFFGSAEEAIGKILRCDNKKDFTVTGVFKDLPENVSAKFDCLIDWHSFLEENSWAKDWGNVGPNTLVLLHKDAHPKQVEAKIKNFLAKYNSAHHKVELGLQPFGDSYLHAEFKDGYLSGGRISYIRLFSIVAIFIVVIACINFMNLTTARSAKRAKEIGIRKVLGASIVSLFALLSKEFVLLILVAFLIATPFTWWIMNTWLQTFAYKIHMEMWMFVAAVLLIIIIAMLTISYQSIKAILMNPIESLKGE